MTLFTNLNHYWCIITTNRDKKIIFVWYFNFFPHFSSMQTVNDLDVSPFLLLLPLSFLIFKTNRKSISRLKSYFPSMCDNIQWYLIIIVFKRTLSWSACSVSYVWYAAGFVDFLNIYTVIEFGKLINDCWAT